MRGRFWPARWVGVAHPHIGSQTHFDYNIKRKLCQAFVISAGWQTAISLGGNRLV